MFDVENWSLPAVKSDTPQKTRSSQRKKSKKPAIKTKANQDVLLKTPYRKQELKPNRPAKSLNNETANFVLEETHGSSNLSALQQKMQDKLSGGKFRWINEILYTKSSLEAQKLLPQDVLLKYHEGFEIQSRKWPENPVLVFLGMLEKELYHGKPRSKSPFTIVDMGCGDAKIAQGVHKLDPKRQKLKVHSFDLVKTNDFVEVCDIRKTPLKDQSVNLVIFCLSLMGTNFHEFLEEASRILVPDGLLWISEIKSRFHDDGSDFINALKTLSFTLKSCDTTNTMFTQFIFQKTTSLPQKAKPETFSDILKPCKYKKR